MRQARLLITLLLAIGLIIVLVFQVLSLLGLKLTSEMHKIFAMFDLFVLLAAFTAAHLLHKAMRDSNRKA